MAMRPHRPAPKQPLKLKPEIQQDGLFTGTAQAGAARQRRAHALAEELLARGCLYIQKQVWDEAAREFRKALQMEEDYAEAYNNLGLCLLYMGKASEAVENLQLALHYFPGWYIAEANLGLALTRLNRNEEALPYYEKAIAQKVQAPICLSLGDAYATLGRLDKAIAAYQNALTVAPKSALAHFRIGMLQARRNNIDDAEAALLKAVQIEPENAEAQAVLGAIASRRGHLSQAEGFFSKVKSLPKVPAPALRGLHRLEVFRTALDKDFAEWKTQMPAPQPLATCYYNLGLALLAANDKGGAKEAFRSAAGADPKWPQPLIWFGFFAALDGDAVSARKQWESAVKLQPENGMLREMLGYLAVAMGLQKDGETHFADAAKLGRAIPQEDIYPDKQAPAAPSTAQAAAAPSTEAGTEEVEAADDEEPDEVDEGAATMIEPAAQ